MEARNDTSTDHPADSQRLADLESANAALKEELARCRHAEQAHRESEARFRSLLENSPDAIFVEDLDGNVLFVNEAACRLHGCDADSLIGQNIRQLVPPENRDEALADFARLTSGEADLVTGYSWRADGEVVPVELHVSLIQFDGQDAVLLHARNVDRRTQAERALYESEERYRQLVENANDVIFRADLKGVLTYVNPAATRITGYEASELIGRTFRSLVKPSHRAAAFSFYRRQFAQQEQDAYYEFPIQAKDGTDKWLGMHAQPVWREGKVSELQAVARDITERREAEEALARSKAELEQRVAERTEALELANAQLKAEILERKQAEQALRESEERFSQAFQAAPVAIGIITLAGGHFIDINEGFTALTGYTRQDLIGLTGLDLELYKSPSDHPYILHALQEQGTLNGFELQICTKQRDERAIEVSAEAIELIGEPCALVMLYDITDRKQLEQEILEISENERRRIGHDLHDDLGQQLTAAAMLAELLRDRLLDEESPHSKSITRISELLNQARTYTRHLSRMLSPVVVQAEGLMDALQGLAENTESVLNIPCRFRVETPVLVKNNDVATHLYRITQEAVSNAIKHANPSKIVIELKLEDDQAHLSICDDGPGLPDNVLQQMKGIGLRTMQYRGDIIGATVTFRHREPHGTIVECTFDV